MDILPLVVLAASTAASAGTASEGGPFEASAELTSCMMTEPHATRLLLAPRLRARIRPSERLAVGARWAGAGLIYSAHRGPGDGAFVSGNPAVEAAWHLLHRGKLDLAVEATVALPLSALPDGEDGGVARAARAQALAADGLWDAWLWAPGRTGLAAALRADAWGSPGGRVEGEVGGSLSLPVREGTEGVEGYLQAAVGLADVRGAHASGVRLQAVVMPAVEVDVLQVAVVAWGRLKVGRRKHLSLRVLFNIDEPLGRLGAASGAWGITLGGGVGL